MRSGGRPTSNGCATCALIGPAEVPLVGPISPTQAACSMFCALARTGRQNAACVRRFPAEVRDVFDERGGRRIGAGRRFAFDFNSVEALFLSFAGQPVR